MPSSGLLRQFFVSRYLNVGFVFFSLKKKKLLLLYCTFSHVNQEIMHRICLNTLFFLSVLKISSSEMFFWNAIVKREDRNNSSNNSGLPTKVLELKVWKIFEEIWSTTDVGKLKTTITATKQQCQRSPWFRSILKRKSPSSFSVHFFQTNPLVKAKPLLSIFGKSV